MYVVGAGVALLMEPPPLSVPVKEAREVESAAPKIGNLAGFGGGGSSDPVEPANIFRFFNYESQGSSGRSQAFHHESCFSDE
jgi:hypothetical protein